LEDLLNASRRTESEVEVASRSAAGKDPEATGMISTAKNIHHAFPWITNHYNE
jgi:hypothetical protein